MVGSSGAFHMPTEIFRQDEYFSNGAQYLPIFFTPNLAIAPPDSLGCFGANPFQTRSANAAPYTPAMARSTRAARAILGLKKDCRALPSPWPGGACAPERRNKPARSTPRKEGIEEERARTGSPGRAGSRSRRQ